MVGLGPELVTPFAPAGAFPAVAAERGFGPLDGVAPAQLTSEASKMDKTMTTGDLCISNGSLGAFARLRGATDYRQKRSDPTFVGDLLASNDAREKRSVGAVAALRQETKFANDMKEIRWSFDIVTHCCAAPIARTD